MGLVLCQMFVLTEFFHGFFNQGSVEESFGDLVANLNSGGCIVKCVVDHGRLVSYANCGVFTLDLGWFGVSICKDSYDSSHGGSLKFRCTVWWGSRVINCFSHPPLDVKAVESEGCVVVVDANLLGYVWSDDELRGFTYGPPSKVDGVGAKVRFILSFFHLFVWCKCEPDGVNTPKCCCDACGGHTDFGKVVNTPGDDLAFVGSSSDFVKICRRVSALGDSLRDILQYVPFDNAAWSYAHFLIFVRAQFEHKYGVKFFVEDGEVVIDTIPSYRFCKYLFEKEFVPLDLRLRPSLKSEAHVDASYEKIVDVELSFFECNYLRSDWRELVNDAM